jgi:CheY-like chemotaxis protein
MIKRRVLAIGPNWRMRRLIQANLEPLGIQVLGAVNGRHSLTILSSEQPDLVLLDSDVADMDATHLLARLRAQLIGSVPIIVLSAEPPSRSHRENGHAVSYLLKPFAAATLLQQVQQALGDFPVDEGRALKDP